MPSAVSQCAIQSILRCGLLVDPLSRYIRLHVYFRLAPHNSMDPVVLRQANCAISDHEFWKLTCPKLL